MSRSEIRIKFAFYWDWEGEKPLPDYYVARGTHGQLQAGMNISQAQILEAGLPIPPTPTFDTWKHLIARKERCGRCWAALKGPRDVAHHVQNVHAMVSL